MDIALVSALLVLLGVIITSLITFLVAKRNTSGTISTSTAASLWEESNALRQEYRQRAETLEEKLGEVTKKLQTVTEELSALRVSAASSLAKMDEMKNLITTLKEANESLLALIEVNKA